MNRLDWEDLRHFTALAETLNLARAAAALRTSQVTVLRRVKALEAALGTTLFLRRRDGHRLTTAGHDLLSATREASLLLDDGARRVAAKDAAASGHVRVATTELAANYLLLTALPAFLADNPDLSLEIDASPEALRLTDDAETIALRFHRPSRGPLRVRKIGEIAFSVYRARRDERGSVRRHIGWAGPFADIGLSRWLRRLYPDAGPVLRLTTFEGHLKAVRAGIGVSALPDFLAEADPSLARLDSDATPFRLEAWLVVPEQIASLDKVRRTVRMIEAAMSITKLVTDNKLRRSHSRQLP